jgi:D-serine deaminase-like pyridoxal phosphate-dependent protein
VATTPVCRLAPVTADYERYEKAFEGVEAPFAFVDLDAMWSNADAMLAMVGNKPIRVASKSVRCRELLGAILGRDERFRGLLTFTLPETVFLASQGFEDLVVAYPSTDRTALREMVVMFAANPEAAPTLMVDCAEHLDLIESELGPKVAPVRVCIDLDAGWWPAGGVLRVGPKRSPLHRADEVVALAREIESRERLRLAGLMAYEGQIAGVGDRPPGRRIRGRIIHAMQGASARELRKRRAKVVEAVSQVHELEFVNAGGTGSLTGTAAEDAVTEVTAGSGFYAPALFDHYSALSLKPAAFFALPVVRKPADGVATALGGGYLASGPATSDRLPVPWLPEGLRLDGQEGAGEVQTPLLGDAAKDLQVGDNVYMRHAKAGELCERFSTLHLVQGGRIVDEVPTYRGEGQTFL